MERFSRHDDIGVSCSHGDFTTLTRAHRGAVGSEKDGDSPIRPCSLMDDDSSSDRPSVARESKLHIRWSRDISRVPEMNCWYFGDKNTDVDTERKNKYAEITDDELGMKVPIPTSK